jgi:hypothetical protein
MFFLSFGHNCPHLIRSYTRIMHISQLPPRIIQPPLELPQPQPIECVCCRRRFWRRAAAGGGGSSVAYVCVVAGDAGTGMRFYLCLGHGMQLSSLIKESLSATKRDLSHYILTNRRGHTPLLLIFRHLPISVSFFQNVDKNTSFFLCGCRLLSVLGPHH